MAEHTREAILAEIDRVESDLAGDFWEGYRQALEWVLDLPAAEPTREEHLRWLLSRANTYVGCEFSNHYLAKEIRDFLLSPLPEHPDK